MSAIETIYDYYEDHAKAAVSVRESRPFLFGIVCFSLGGVSLFVAQAMAHKLRVLPFSFSALWLSILWEVGTGFVLAAVLHMILEVEGIEGSAVGLFVLLGLANLVWAMAVPLVLIFRLLAPAKQWPASVVFLGVGLLSLSLKARSLRDNYHIGLARAWVTLFLPYIAVFLAVALALTLAFWIAILKFIQWAH